MNIDPTGHDFWEWLAGIGSALAIVAGVVLCFIPGMQPIGAGLIVMGASSLIGGGVSVASVGSFKGMERSTMG